MKAYTSLAALAFGLVAGVPVANAQALVAQPYQPLIVQPGATVTRGTPLFAVTAGQPVEIITTVETVRTIRLATRPVVRHHIVASRKFQDRIADDRRACRCAGRWTRTVRPISLHPGMRRRIGGLGVRHPERLGPQSR
jgi:hypothetical protein